LGVLIKAKQQGYLDVIRPHVEQMQRGDIRLGDALVARALEMVGE
jgi:predicted nucleic acid-binding protein